MLKIEIQETHIQVFTCILDAATLEQLVARAVAEQAGVNLKSKQVTHTVTYERDDYGSICAISTITVDRVPTAMPG